MHIIIKHNAKHVAIACVEREAGTATVLHSCCDAHQQQLEAALQGLNVPAVTMNVQGIPAVEWMKERGWNVIPDAYVMVKELRK